MELKGSFKWYQKLMKHAKMKFIKTKGDGGHLNTVEDTKSHQKVMRKQLYKCSIWNKSNLDEVGVFI